MLTLEYERAQATPAMRLLDEVRVLHTTGQQSMAQHGKAWHCTVKLCSVCQSSHKHTVVLALLYAMCTEAVHCCSECPLQF